MDDGAGTGTMGRVDALDRTRAGDDGFDAFFLSHVGPVTATVRHVVGDRQVAEEVAQEAFVRLLAHWRKVSGYERPDLWVRRVAIRLAQRERQRAWRRPGVERSGPPMRDPGSADPDDDVLAAVRTLAPKQRAVVVLFYFEDRPMAEIAEILGCSVSTGWSQLHTARKRLAAALSEEVTEDVR